MSEKFAFRCNTCRRLETSDNAGAGEFPGACPSCGSGVTYNPKNGAKEFHPENWTVLADLKGEEQEDVLSFHGITKSQIQKHKPTPSDGEDREPQMIEREAADTLGAEDKTS